MTTHSEVTTGSATDAPSENPNADVIAGLREIADWLEEHPELTEIRAHIWQATPWRESQDDARVRLLEFAAALGGRATEHVRNNNVEIEAKFGDVKLHADASVYVLAGEREPARPTEYVPILGEFSVRR